jgi:hypothetical protein
MRVEQLDAHLSFRLTVIAGGGLLECGTPARLTGWGARAGWGG